MKGSKLQNRNISQILEENKRTNSKKIKLDIKLISVISKTRVKTLKQKRANKTGGLTNGHAHDEGEEINENGEEFINDCYNAISEKPEFFKYFGNKCTTPCFVPEQIAFPKLTSGN